MKTTKHGHENNDVVLAFAELARLENERASFANAKREALERLAAQRTNLRDLRERLDAERPHAWARIRREQLRNRRVRERAAAEARAQAETEHVNRLSRYRAELEAKRARLAHLESLPEVPRPGRKLLEWSVPAAATALVAMLSFTVLGEHQAEAHTPDTIVELEAEHMAFHGEALAIPLAAPAPEAPMAEEDTPEPETKKKATKKTKKKATKKTTKKTTKDKDTKPKTGIKERTNKLVLDDTGNPLR